MFCNEYIIPKFYCDVNKEKYMKADGKILVAFILNLAFSVFEFIGGIFTGSVAILSDSVHDIGDAASIGMSYFLEKKSRREPDERYTYGYARYSVVGGVITTLVLLLGSGTVIVGAVWRIIEPRTINYDGMIVFAVVGVLVNLLAAMVTHGGGSIGQRAVNLHMLEDVLGWGVVLVGAVVMRFTDISVIDPVMSIGVAVFIIVNAVRTFASALDVFLEKAPRGIDVHKLSHHVAELDGVRGVHHVHVWSMDGVHSYATMHVVTDADSAEVKRRVRDKLAEHGIHHATIEIEAEGEECGEENCSVNFDSYSHHYGHHHEHHHHHGNHHH